jgi:hypothetical protein
MPIVRATEGLLLCAAVVLAACAGMNAAPEPAHGATLAGSWKIDHGAGDDPQKILDRMRAQAFKIMGRRPAPEPEPNPTRRGSGTHGSPAPAPAATEEPQPPPTASAGHRPDPLQYSPMAHIILRSVARGDFLTVRQGPGEFVLDYGTSTRSFTPGAHSVVSAEGGVGDQTSGWRRGTYVIEIKAQLGPTVTEQYALSADGKHLVATLHIAAAELPAVTLTRIYSPTTEIAPRQLPTAD